MSLVRDAFNEVVSSAVRIKKLVDCARARSMMGEVAAADLESVRFGFFGEFGFGLALWLPFLNYLKARRLGPIKTVGPMGSRPFYYFSDDHLELPVPTLNGWGDEKTLLKIRSAFRERLVCPSSGVERNLVVDGISWRSTDLKRRSSPENYQPLDYKADRPAGLPERYCVVCVKDYYNFGNTNVRNFFTATDLNAIIDMLAEKQYVCALNHYPEPKDSFNIYTHEKIITDDIKKRANVIDLADIYAVITNANDRNRFQLQLLTHAKVIFASQGGNGILSLVAGPASAVLMRGGFDYPTLGFLRDTYKRPCMIAYEVDDLLSWAGSLLLGAVGR